MFWSLTKNHEYTVKSCYHLLNDGGLRSKFNSQVWKTKAPLNVKIFTWLTLHNKIITRENLSKKGWVGPLHCVFSNAHTETFLHLLLHCPFVNTIWNFLTWSTNSELNSFNCVDQVFPLSHADRFHLDQGHWNMLVLALFWVITWTTRNALISRNVQKDI